MQEPQYLRDNEAGRDGPNEWHRHSLSRKLNAPAFSVLALDELAIGPILARDLFRSIFEVIICGPEITAGSRVGQRMQVDRVEVVSGTAQATLHDPDELGGLKGLTRYVGIEAA
jgi:hypothetical protein